MKKSKFTERQILGILEEAEKGIAVKELSRKYGVSESAIYIWRNKYAGMRETELRRLKQLEEENRQLKRMYADLSLDHQIIKDILSKKS